jgi:diguanylate cyclase (GGDEF)-like protein/PAS domain S-box-containing protein
MSLSSSSFRPLLDAMPDSTILVDQHERVRALNREAERLFGWSEQDLLGELLSQILPSCSASPVGLAGRSKREPASPWRGWSSDLVARRRDGSEFPVALARRPLGSGSDTRSLVTVRDLQLWPASGTSDVSGEEVARVTLASIGDAVITADTSSIVTYLNPVAERLTGWSMKEATGVPLDEVLVLVSEMDRKPIRHRAVRCLEENQSIHLPDRVLLIRRDGVEIPIGDSISPVLDSLGKPRGVVVVVQDETENRQEKQQLTYEATHDPLTDLVNRREFERRLTRVMRDLEGTSADHALLYIDLDHFKLVNDTSGHTEGDELLRRIGPLLRPCLRKRDTLARIGGDEFGILLEHCPLKQARRVAENVRSAVERMDFSVGSRTFSLAASIGLVPLTSGRTSLEDLIRSADVACYAAKAGGGNRVHVGRQTPQGARTGPEGSPAKSSRATQAPEERSKLSLL